MSDTFAALEFDPANEVHSRAVERLAAEQLVWLGTVDRHGFPHAVPVWFLWHDGAAHVLVQPGSVKTKNVLRDPKVLLHFETDEVGDDVTVLQGVAEVAEEPAASWFAREGIGDAYVAKYADGLARLDWTLEYMLGEYSTVLSVRPTKLIGWL